MAQDGPRPLPGLPEVTVQRNVPSRMRDGVTLYADVYRPAGEGPFPVILMRHPYDKTQAQNINYSHPSWYAQRGYMVIVQDIRGYWVSEGTFTPYLHEAEDGYDTIEWAAHLPEANGRVGMYGFSYAGATQLMPATLRPPSLVTVCPALTASQYYEGWTYNQGALALAFTMSWAVHMAGMEARRARDDEAIAILQAAYANSQGWNWYLPLANFPPLTGKYGSYFFDWLAHPTYDDYWRRWSIDEDYSRLTIPALVEAAEQAAKLGIPAIALFPVIPLEKKSEQAEEAWRADNLCNRAVTALMFFTLHQSSTSSARRVLPMPASPRITNIPARPAAAACHALSSVCHSA